MHSALEAMAHNAPPKNIAPDSDSEGWASDDSNYTYTSDADADARVPRAESTHSLDPVVEVPAAAAAAAAVEVVEGAVDGATEPLGLVEGDIYEGDISGAVAHSLDPVVEVVDFGDDDGGAPEPLELVPGPTCQCHWACAVCKTVHVMSDAACCTVARPSAVRLVRLRARATLAPLAAVSLQTRLTKAIYLLKEQMLAPIPASTGGDAQQAVWRQAASLFRNLRAMMWTAQDSVDGAVAVAAMRASTAASTATTHLFMSDVLGSTKMGKLVGAFLACEANAKIITEGLEMYIVKQGVETADSEAADDRAAARYVLRSLTAPEFPSVVFRPTRDFDEEGILYYLGVCRGSANCAFERMNSRAKPCTRALTTKEAALRRSSRTLHTCW